MLVRPADLGNVHFQHFLLSIYVTKTITPDLFVVYETDCNVSVLSKYSHCVKKEIKCNIIQSFLLPLFLFQNNV